MTASGTPRAETSATARSSSRLAMPARWWDGATAIISTSPTGVASSSVQRTATKPIGTPSASATHTSIPVGPAHLGHRGRLAVRQSG
jgi:hypothetical protein